MGFRRFLKKSVKFNKDLLSGKIVKKLVKKGASVAKKNPELLAAGLTAATGGGFGALQGVLGGLFGIGGGGSPPPEPVGESAVMDDGPPLPPGIPTRTILLAAGGIAAVLLIARK
jgi:hypothetical protein